MKNDYYVYIFFNPSTNLPFYVGKGKGDRYKQHEKEIDKQLDYLSNKNKNPEKLLSLKQKMFYDLKSSNITPKLEVVDDLNETDSFLLEHSLIAWFGRKLCGNGVLTNVLSGGKNGDLLFEEQQLIEIYKRPDLLEKIIIYPRMSTSWVAKTLYFYSEDAMGYPFTELSIDWLNKKINFEQYAVEVIEKLKEYDAIITPFYWVRKVKHSKLITDNTFIFENSLDLINGTYWDTNAIKNLHANMKIYNELVNKF